MAKVKNLRGRIWTPNELQESALVPVDKENCFATNLENLALTSKAIFRILYSILLSSFNFHFFCILKSISSCSSSFLFSLRHEIVKHIHVRPCYNVLCKIMNLNSLALYLHMCPCKLPVFSI